MIAEIGLLVAYSIAALVALFLFYVILFQIHYSRFSKIAKVLAIPFVIADFATNMGPMSVLMLELPREYLVTARLKRYKRYTGTGGMRGYRRDFAFWLCEKLNKYDPEHC